MVAIVLAGGFGTRIKPVVSDVPKPMAPVAGNPFLVYLLKDLVKQGIQKIVLAVGYKREVIISYFGSHFESAELLYSIEEQPLGTGGGIRKALELIQGEEVLIINGDTFFDLPFRDLIEFHRQGSYDLTLGLKPLENFDRYGTVVIEKGRVIAMHEKQPCKRGLINGGVYVMNPKILSHFPLNTQFSFETEVLEKEIHRLKFGGFISDTYFIDIGIPEDYLKVQEDFKRRTQKPTD